VGGAGRNSSVRIIKSFVDQWGRHSRARRSQYLARIGSRFTRRSKSAPAFWSFSSSIPAAAAFASFCLRRVTGGRKRRAAPDLGHMLQEIARLVLAAVALVKELQHFDQPEGVERPQ
jgi:hypothetical protein